MSIITVNLTKAKSISHDLRRQARAKEFEPYDKIIQLQIPGTSATDAETERVKIRTKYAIIQDNIDNATDVQTLTTIISEFK